jgi:hypothetical protein
VWAFMPDRFSKSFIVKASIDISYKRDRKKFG